MNTTCNKRKTILHLSGFAVASGRFDTRSVSYVGGAPRSNSTGIVVLFVMDGNNRLTYREHQVLHGELPFSAFGYSLLAVDLNADGFDDLIVGSPMYLDKNTGGAIYIYMGGSEITTTTKPKKILGKKATEDECMKFNCEDARFGYALAKAGDLNNDNFQGIPLKSIKYVLFILNKSIYLRRLIFNI